MCLGLGFWYVWRHGFMYSSVQQTQNIKFSTQSYHIWANSFFMKNRLIRSDFSFNDGFDDWCVFLILSAHSRWVCCCRALDAIRATAVGA